MTRTERPHWRGMSGQSSMLLYIMRWGHYRLVVCRTWWQSGSGCPTRDLIKISPLGSRDPYNWCWRLGPGSCPDSRPPSDLLGGRRCLPEH